jgi:hypothetical protein
MLYHDYLALHYIIANGGASSTSLQTTGGCDDFVLIC